MFLGATIIKLYGHGILLNWAPHGVHNQAKETIFCDSWGMQNLDSSQLVGPGSLILIVAYHCMVVDMNHLTFRITLLVVIKPLIIEYIHDRQRFIVSTPTFIGRFFLFPDFAMNYASNTGWLDLSMTLRVKKHLKTI